MSLAAIVTAIHLAAVAAPAPVVLSKPDEPGERLMLTCRLLDPRGKPVAGASVVGYHADRGGLYNPPGAGTNVPRLRGTAVSGADGRFAIATVRPGPYPGVDEPAHIHLEITAPGRKTYSVTFWFDDDPLLTSAKRDHAARDAELAILKPTRNADGVWTASDDIRLPAK
jgi:protocatechuate 3,4-dioxygenase beta subunit